MYVYTYVYTYIYIYGDRNTVNSVVVEVFLGLGLDQGFKGHNVVGSVKRDLVSVSKET
jgi:hypothetical protein